jgi:hypothetical protein
MREIITIQIGQAGNSIGEKVRKIKEFFFLKNKKKKKVSFGH